MRRALLWIVFFPSLAAAEPLLEEFSGGTISDELRGAMRDALYEELPLLGDGALAPRPAGVAKLRMDDLVKRYPREAVVQKYLGRICYTTGDVTCAEHAYQSAVDLSSKATWAIDELAQLYALRNQPKDELATLDKLAEALRPQAVGATATADGKSKLRESWQRARAVAAAHAGPGVAEAAKYDRLVVELYPDDPSYLRRYVDGLLAGDKGAAALAEVARYKKSFPGETRYFASVESQVAENRRDGDKAEVVYRSIFAKSPMPAVDGDGLYDDYLDLLKRQAHLREVKRALSAKARAGKIAGGDLALLVHLLSHDGDRDQARQILDAAAQTPGSSTELLLRARLYATVGTPAAAVPILYGAYRKATAAKDKEESLGELGIALLSGDAGRTGLTPLGPLDGFRLRHVASGPSVAGGLSSLLWNGVHRGAADDLDQVEAAYGNGARAGAVLVELKKVAPKSKRTAALMRALVDFRRSYRDDADAIKLADEFARAFPRDPAFFDVARAGCDSRWKSRAGGHDCYVKLLDEATRRGDGRAYDTTLREVTSAYETERKQVEIVRLFWAELAKRPWDSALYEHFLEQLSRHNLFDDELKVYQEGIKHFGTSAWYDRLARWHLRHRNEQSFRDLTERLLVNFDDELAAEYLESLVNWRNDSDDGRVFFETIYRHALDRFPLDRRFATRLISFYDNQHHPDHARAMKLVHRYAFFDGALLSRTLGELARRGTLDATVASLGKGKNVLERQLAASGLTFLSRQEEAEPILAAVCADFPGDVPLARRHAALVRAIAKPSAHAAAQSASSLLDGLTRLFPADEALVTEAGDYLSEANLFDEASKRYERIIAITPSDPEAYLRLASIDWDYFHFDQAADAIARARKRSGDPLRFADKLAAVYESRKDYPSAIAEYVRLVVGAQKLDARSRIFSRDEQRGEEGGDYEGEGDWRDSGAAADPGAGAALDRLRYLAGRKKLGPAIDKAWRAQLATGDGRAVLGYSAYLGTMGDDAARRKLLIAEAGKSSDPRLLERIAGDARGNAEMEGVLVAALARESALGKGAPSYVYPLVEALAADQRDADAEKELSSLAGRLDGGGEDDREEAIEAHVAYANFLWQRSRWDDALAQRDAAAARAVGERKIALQLEAIRDRTTRDKLDDAEKGARALVDAHPGAARFVGPLAEVLWKRGDRDGTVALFEAQMKAARATKENEEVKRAMVIQLRHLLIDKLELLDRAREAVDQWIEIVNRPPLNLVEVTALHHYASAHALVPRVVGYYEKTAKTSSKDVRWPILLATLADLESDPKRAAGLLGDALQISPDRQDLAKQRAEAFARAGDPLAAATVYHRLWELADHDPTFAGLEGSMLARGGKRAEAVACIKRLVENEPPEPQQWWRAADLLVTAGLLDDAWPLASRAIEKASKDLRGQSLDRLTADGYARLAVRSGHLPEAWKVLRQLEDKARGDAGTEGNSEPWRASSTSDACADAINDALPKAVASYAADGDARKFADLVRTAAHGDGNSTAWPERAARIAVAAGRPDLAREIYLRERPRDSRDHFFRELLADYENAGQWQAALKLLDERHSSESNDVLTQARICRILGDPCEEAALKRYVAILPTWGNAEGWRFGARDASLDRYLDLLMARKREAELQALAQRGTLHAQQVIDYLFAHGRADLGQQAIDAAAKPETPAWRNAKQATALLALGGNGAKARDLLAVILAPKPIGDALGHHPDPRSEVSSRRWFRYGERYGDALAQAGQTNDARRWYASTVEDQPRSGSAYLAQGDALMRIADRARAQASYEHAIELKSSGNVALDHLARSFLSGGDKKRALATWDRVLSGKRVTESAQRHRFELVLAAGLTDEARAPYADHLAAGWKKRQATEALADLRALGTAYPSHAGGGDWERFLRGLLDQSGWRDRSLLGAMADGDLLEVAAREPYLRMIIERDPPESKSAAREKLAGWGIETRHFDATLDAVAAEEKSAGAARPPFWIALQRARARAGKGDVDRAALDLIAATKDRDDEEKSAAATLLSEIRSPREWDLRLTMARDKVARLDHPGSDEITLADLLLRRGDKDEGARLLRRLVVRKLDDSESYELAAATAEKWKQPALARDLRRALSPLTPRDGVNLVALATDERDAGNPAEAVKIAAAVIGDRSTEVKTRREAGILLGDLARARVAGGDAAISGLSSLGSDEPLLLARSHAADDGAPLADGLAQLAAPRTALLELTDRAEKKGRHADAAVYLRRLRDLGIDDQRLRRRQFAEERAAGHPGAALAALADRTAERWAGAVTADRAELEARAERSLAAAVEEGRAQMAKLTDGEGLQLARDAALAAAQAGEPERAGYYLALVDALAPSKEAHARAVAARQAIDKRRRTDARRFITAGIDDFTIAPLFGGAR